MAIAARLPAVNRSGRWLRADCMFLLELPCLDNLADDDFPPTATALEDPNGLLAWGGTLNSTRLISAYRKGIFPWYSEGEPLLWWTPSPRCVLELDKVYVSRRTRRRLRQGAFEITADTAFENVIAACAAPGIGRATTWITDPMLAAYNRLHLDGVAHSIEAWQDGVLVGGIYGLAIGHMFFGESMFSSRPDASKTALITLCRQLQDWNFGPIDCQVGNPHLLRMGAREVEREVFESWLAEYTAQPRPDGSWQSEFQARTDW